MSDDQPTPSADRERHPDLQEILAKRREMLNRVRADLRKVDELQKEFKEKRTPRPASAPPANTENKNG